MTMTACVTARCPKERPGVLQGSRERKGEGVGATRARRGEARGETVGGTCEYIP